MTWLTNLFTATDSVAHIALLYALVIAVGVYLGKIKFAGISLGVTFVLFAGIVAGHFGMTAPTATLTFVQDFGLILFVFMIGLQVGPGFFESFKKGGVELNSLAAGAILLNIAVMFACYFCFFDTSDIRNLPMMVGTLYGAVTNTPGLGAANEALNAIFPDGNVPPIANGYACAYPLGVVGIILATIAIRFITRTKLEEEEKKLELESADNANIKPHMLNLRVKNTYLEGKTIQQLRDFLNRKFIASRIMHEGKVIIPKSMSEVHVDDILYIVCTENDAEAIIAFIGPEEEVDWDIDEQRPM
ncbi:MAG: transporter, partial [Bacteroidaceae bacterium]|nr:transporter [Bacteroidaceae bacterium]